MSADFVLAVSEDVPFRRHECKYPTVSDHLQDIIPEDLLVFQRGVQLLRIIPDQREQRFNLRTDMILDGAEHFGITIFGTLAG